MMDCPMYSYVNSIFSRKTAIYTSTSMWNMMINSMAVKLMDHPIQSLAGVTGSSHPAIFWQNLRGIFLDLDSLSICYLKVIFKKKISKNPSKTFSPQKKKLQKGFPGFSMFFRWNIRPQLCQLSTQLPPFQLRKPKIPACHSSVLARHWLLP